MICALPGLAGCATAANAEAPDDTKLFEIGTKNLLPPELFDRNLVVTVGTPPATPIEQPIAFTHTRHVQDLGLDCNYCHSNARKGIHAGVPSTQVCMGCHALVDTTDRPELEKLKGYWERGETIPWAKVHDLPDYVYFSHKRHVTAGLDCQECHGQVQEMTVNQRVSPLNMGWCLDCHAQHQSIDENYGTKAELRRAELKDCWTCHK
jgi:predicted CXXCH cytochrome family protein